MIFVLCVCVWSLCLWKGGVSGRVFGGGGGVYSFGIDSLCGLFLLNKVSPRTVSYLWCTVGRDGNDGLIIRLIFKNILSE